MSGENLMIRKNWLESCGRGALVVLFLFTLALVAIVAPRLSAQTALGTGIVLKPVSPPGFVVAPSVPLGYSPSSIASGALTSSGHTDVVTADSVAGKITVFTGQGHGTFAPGVTYAAGAQPTSLVIADVDGDGRADVVLANSSEGVISVFPGNGDGTLGARKTFAIGFMPSFVAVGDFTGNGRLDIAVAGATGKSLAILQNAGAGNLNRPVNLGLTSAPAAIIAADFNHDGHIDLAVASTAGTVTVFLGKGNGQFSALPDVSIVSGALSSIAVGDFNRDGNPDIVVTSSALNQAAVLLGHGDGNFASATLLAVGNSPVATRIADVDGDGIPDLIVINKGNNTFSVLNGVGDGTFKSAANFVVGNAPLDVATADFYGNGKVDLATINQLGQNLSVPSGNGDGTFVAGRAYGAGVQPVAVASGDLTRSGRSDMVVANYCAADATCGGSGSAAVLLAGPGGVYQLGSTYAMGTGSVGIYLVDVNGDGVLDLIALNRVDRSVSLRLGTGDGSFGSLITIPLAAAPVSMVSGSFIKGGHTDFAIVEDCGTTTCSIPGQVEILRGLGDGNFRSTGTYAVGYAPVALVTGVIRTGAAPDVVVANRCGSDASCKSGGTASILLGSDNGAFRAGPDIPLGNSPSSVALADLRGTGILDLVVSRSTENTVAVLPGVGDGTFGTAVPYAVGQAPGALAVADFNGDGKPDVAVANTADSTVSVLFGKAGGALNTSFTVPVSGNPSSLTAIASGTGRASLATPGGNIATPTAASNVTVVANLINPHALAVNPGTPVLTVTPAGNLSVNQSVTVSVSVPAAGGNGVPTGNVQFQYSTTGAGGPFVNFSDGTCGGATGKPLDATGAASCVTQQLPQNAALVMQANYLGDGTIYNGLASNQVTRLVNAAATTTVLTSNPAAPTTDEQVTLTATISPTVTPAVVTDTQTIAGTVAFNDTTTATTLCPAAAVVFDSTAGTASLTCQVLVLTVATHNLTATFTPSGTNYTSTGPGTLSLDVTAAPTKTTVTPSPNPSTVNGSVTFNVTVAPNVSGTQSPNADLATIAGTVTVKDGGTDITGCSGLTVTYSTTNGNATTSCNDNTLTAAASPHSITAVFAPTGTNYLTSTTTPAVSLPTNKAATTLTISAPAPVAVNTSVTFTAALGGTLTPTTPITTGAGIGTLDFIADAGTGNAVTLCSGVPLTTGATFSTGYGAQCSTNVLNGNTHTISATYTGDTNFASTLPGAVTTASYTPIKAATTLAVSAPGATTVNSSVQFTATLSSALFTPVPPITGAGAGTVTFTADAGGANPITLCTGVALTTGAAFSTGYGAQCTSNALPVGATPHTITATYTGDTSFAIPGSTTTASYNPTQLQGTFTGAAIANTTVDTPVTFTVTYNVTPVTPFAPSTTGTPVSFTINGVAQTALCPLASLNGSQQAICTTSGLKAGNYVLAATYAGDINFKSAQTTSTTNFTVGPATPVVAVSSDAVAATAVVNQPVTFTATVKPPAAGAQTILPNGTVAFTTQGGTVLCGSVGVIPTGTPAVPTATCTYKFASPLAATTVVASYNAGDGDPNFVTTVTASTPITVNTTHTTLQLSTSGTVNVGQAATLTTVIKPDFQGPPSFPQGTVSFVITGASPAPTGTCTTPLTVNPTDGTVQQCTLTFTTGSTGSGFSVQATFNPTAGNTNFSSSSGSTPQPVNSGTLGIKLLSGIPTAVTSPSFVNQPVTFNASFTPPIPIPAPAGTVIPVGAVTYTDNSVNITNCVNLPVQADGTILPCTTTFTLGGSHPIVASFAPSNASYQPTSSNIFSQVVNQNQVATTVTPATTSGAVNLNATFTATLAPATFAGATGTLAAPTGTVTFKQSPNASGVDPCTNVPLTPAPITCSITFTAVGTYSITAVYNGDNNFTNGAPTPASVTIGGATTTVIVNPAQDTTVIPPAPFVFNVNKPGGTFTVTVKPQTVGGAVPTGTVTFVDSDSATDVCVPKQLVPDTTPGNTGFATASCPVIFHTQGAHTLTANYGGDANFPPPKGQTIAASGSLLVNVDPDPIPTPNGFTIKSGGTVSANQPVTYTTTLTPQYGGAGGTLPKGSIVFTTQKANPPATTVTGTCTASGGVPIALDGTIPTCTLIFGAADSYNVTATFNQTGTNFAPASATVGQSISKADAPLVINAPAGSVTNQGVTFTALFSPAVVGTQPTGTVDFNSTLTPPNGPTSSVPLCAKVSLITTGTGANTTTSATCQLPLKTAGSYSVSATYGADINFNGASTTVPATVVVSPALSTVKIASDSGTGTTVQSAVNAVVNFTATVTPPIPDPTLSVPTKTVNFFQNQVAIPGCQNVPVSPVTGAGSAVATCTHQFTAKGSFTITATYSGDSNFLTVDQASSIAVTQIVGNSTMTYTLTPTFAPLPGSPTAPIVNEPVTYTLRIFPSTPFPSGSTGITAPTGVITFTDPDTSTVICGAPSLVPNSNDGSSTATCSITFVKQGSHTIKADYKGDANFAPGSQSNTISVATSPTSLDLVASVANVNLPAQESFATETVIYTAKVTSSIPNANLAVPLGSVTFSSTDSTVQAQCNAPVAVIPNPNGDGTALAVCSAVFPHLPAGSAPPTGSVDVTAIYNDPTSPGNFASSAKDLTQIIMDFNSDLTIAKATSNSVSTPTAIYVTPGFASAASVNPVDPWGPATITSTYTVSGSYIDPDKNIIVDCNVYASKTPDRTKPLSDPSCVELNRSAGQRQFALNVGPNVSTGAYTVDFTTHDGRHTSVTNGTPLTFTHSTVLYVVGQSSLLSLAHGSRGQQTLTFNTSTVPASGDTINGIACGTIQQLDSNKKVIGTIDNTANDKLTCGFVAQTAVGNSGTTQVAVQFNTNPKGTVSAVHSPGLSGSSSTLYAAAVFGLPFMALLGWFGSKRSPRRTLYRFLSMLLLMAGLSYATGCSSSVNHTVTTSTGQGIGVGDYLVQVAGTGQSGNNYYAVMELLVNDVK
jgi:hypothetical protein